MLIFSMLIFEQVNFPGKVRETGGLNRVHQPAASAPCRKRRRGRWCGSSPRGLMATGWTWQVWRYPRFSWLPSRKLYSPYPTKRQGCRGWALNQAAKPWKPVDPRKTICGGLFPKMFFGDKSATSNVKARRIINSKSVLGRDMLVGKEGKWLFGLGWVGGLDLWDPLMKGIVTAPLATYWSIPASKKCRNWTRIRDGKIDTLQRNHLAPFGRSKLYTCIIYLRQIM